MFGRLFALRSFVCTFLCCPFGCFPLLWNERQTDPPRKNPRNARVISAGELGTMSKNNLRGITLVRRPIWRIRSLITLIISWLILMFCNINIWKMPHGFCCNLMVIWLQWNEYHSYWDISGIGIFKTARPWKDYIPPPYFYKNIYILGPLPQSDSLHGVPIAFSGFPAFPPPDSYCTDPILKRMKTLKQKKTILFYFSNVWFLPALIP